jgi:pSer/pThr/pTyr-binding forkhead associated (FHA) protein
MSKLLITGPDMIPREFEITCEMTLGRNAGNDINLQEEKASRRHCRFRPDGDTYIVEDLQSSNGTKVNGRKITTCVLKNGDTITIGQHTIVFHGETPKFDRTIVLPDEDGKLAVGMKAIDAPMPQPKSKQVVLETPNEDEIVARRKKEREQKSDEEHLRDAADNLKKPQTVKIATLCALVIVFILTVNFIVKRHGGDASQVAEIQPQPPPPVQPIPEPEIKPTPPVD